MNYAVRHYRPDSDDLHRMIELIQAVWLPERRASANFHVGDLYWRLREPGYEQELWLWENKAGELLAFVEWNAPAACLDFQIHPQYAGMGLEADILAWAEREIASAAGPSSLTTSLTKFAAETDTAFLALLEARGYRRQEAYYNCHAYLFSALDAKRMEPPSLPVGYSVRHLTGPQEVEARVAGHRAGWQSTKMTADIYRRMMALPGYHSKLDIVVVAPDGTIVSTCNCWLDERSKAGLFEPVSTHFEHRRKGLGRALIHAGLQQLQAAGAQTAWVSSRSDNPASTRLYESCGLRVIHRDYEYQRNFP